MLVLFIPVCTACADDTAASATITYFVRCTSVVTNVVFRDGSGDLVTVNPAAKACPATGWYSTMAGYPVVLEHEIGDAGRFFRSTPGNRLTESGHGPTRQQAAATEPQSTTNRMQGQLAAVRLLVAAGADINARTRQNRTPLAYALESDRAAVIRYLRQRGGTE
jgi:hypothetical protein